MTDQRSTDTTPLNPPDVDVADMADEIAGQEPRDEQDGILATDQVELRQPLNDEQVNENMAGAMGVISRVDDPESIELLEDLDLRSDETSDPNIAAEEGLAYVPPMDPPVVPSSDQGLEMAAGFGTSSLDEPYDLSHHSELLPSEDEMTDRVREAIRADAATTQYADSIEIETSGDRVLLRGVVDDLEDDDSLVAVASTVEGVAEVIDRLEVADL